jgi:transcriptional regulator with XRE-family HTH domain
MTHFGGERTKVAGQRLRRARKAARVSRVALAEAMQVDAVTIARFESGALEMTPAEVRRAAQVVDVDVAYFEEEQREYVIAPHRENVIELPGRRPNDPDPETPTGST